MSAFPQPTRCRTIIGASMIHHTLTTYHAPTPIARDFPFIANNLIYLQIQRFPIPHSGCLNRGKSARFLRWLSHLAWVFFLEWPDSIDADKQFSIRRLLHYLHGDHTRN